MMPRAYEALAILCLVAAIACVIVLGIRSNDRSMWYVASLGGILFIVQVLAWHAADRKRGGS